MLSSVAGRSALAASPVARIVAELLRFRDAQCSRRTRAIHRKDFSLATPPVNRPQLGIAFMCASIFNLAAMEAIAKLLTEDYPWQMVAWARYSFHFVFVLPLFMTVWPARLLRTKRMGLHMVRSIILTAASFFFIGGLSLIPLADATALVFLAPLIVTAISALFLGEAVGIRRWIAVIVGFGGVLVIVRPSPDFTNWAALLPLGAGCCYALYQVSTRILSYTEHAYTLFFYTAFGGFIATTAIVPFYWVTPSWGGFGLLIATGSLGFLGQFLLIKALSVTDASIAAPFIYTQLIWATIYGVLIWGHFPDVYTLVGAAIVIASGIYIWNRERRKAKARKAAARAEAAAAS